MSDSIASVFASRRKTGIARFAGHVGVLSAALMLGACAQGEGLQLGLGKEEPKTTDIATSSAGPASQAELEKATSYWGEQHAKNPRDGKAAMAYARNLKALGRKAQALATLQASYIHNGDDREFLSEYGRLALDQGQVSTAAELLARADDPGKPDWRIISARGTVQAKQGNYKEAIDYFERARTMAPSQASVLNNLAMAYTMDGQAAKGEELLRQAEQAGSSDPRVKKNLALVMDLQGKGGEAVGVPVEAKPAGVVAATAPTTTLKPAQAVTVKTAQRTASKAAATPAAGQPLDPDAIIRAAMDAETAKAR